MRRRFLLLDVDNTLYPPSRGVVELVDGLINRYLVERVGIVAAQVAETRRELRRRHGTTLRGLMHLGTVDADDYLRFVHAIELGDLLSTDPVLAAMLDRIPLPKVAVTNGSTAHAQAVLERLGIRGRFFRVYALEQLGYVPKPFPEAYHAVLRDLGAEAHECVLVEDSLANIATARALGMRTVHVGAADGAPAAADVAIPSVLELERALAALEGGER